MDLDPFDYDELRRNVDDLLNDEYGDPADEFDVHFDDADLPDDHFPVRNAANGYGVQADGLGDETPDYDEEAAAMQYDPQTNAGAAIRAYNTDYASRAAQKANKAPAPRPSRPRTDADATRRIPRQRETGRDEVLARLERPRRQQETPRPVRPVEREELPPVRKKKKHGFLKFLLVLLLLIVAAMIALWVFSRQPEGSSLGEHRDGCASILLAGTDADGGRTDTMMLLYLDKDAGEMNLLSLPRDTYTSMDISVPKLNAAYGLGGGGKAGMETLMDYTEECIGYRPDGYILVDLDGFAKLVNLMGGVRFDVPMDMQYDDPAQDLHIDLRAGEQKLSGEEAMWVVRFRSGYAQADLQRVQVQRDFMRAALDQWLSVRNIWKAPAAAGLVTANTTTNLSLRELSWIARTAKAIGTDNMQTDTLPGEAADVGDGSYYILWPETTANLVNEHYNPYREDVSSESIYSPYY